MHAVTALPVCSGPFCHLCLLGSCHRAFQGVAPRWRVALMGPPHRKRDRPGRPGP